MKVLMTKGFLATRSHASKPCLSIRERAGTRFTSMPVMPGGTGRRNRCQTFFRFTYFHGPSAARPLGWPLRMTNGKVSIKEPLASLMGQQAAAKIVQQREVEAGVRQVEAEGILPLHAAADGIGRQAVGEPFDRPASPRPGLTAKGPLPQDAPGADRDRQRADHRRACRTRYGAPHRGCL